jgi:type III secretory pathway component EscS
MWFFNFIPETLFYALFIAAVIGYLVSLLLPNTLLQKQVKITSVVVLVVSIYLLGMLKVNNWWKDKTAALEQQVVELAAKSAETNTIIEKQLVTKTQVVKVRGEEITKYIDREIVKYNTQCEIPKEFITQHNRAAEQPK